MKRAEDEMQKKGKPREVRGNVGGDGKEERRENRFWSLAVQQVLQLRGTVWLSLVEVPVGSVGDFSHRVLAFPEHRRESVSGRRHCRILRPLLPDCQCR